MPPQLYKLVLFSLIPFNKQAKEVVAHSCNNYLISVLPNNRTLVLDIGFYIQLQSPTILASLGHGDGNDIVVEHIEGPMFFRDQLF